MEDPVRPISQSAINSTNGTTVGSVEQQSDSAALAADVVQDVPVTSDGLEEFTTQGRNENFSSISGFLARNRVTGFSRSNRFIVDFQLQKLFSELNQQDFSNLLSFKCEQAEFPGRELITSDARIYGPSYKSPYMSAYGDVTLTLLCDNNLIQKQIFETWMSIINTPYSFDFKYREDYVCTVQITQYNELNQAMFMCHLLEAYPVSVAPLQTNWGDDAVNRLQVTLTYRYWKSEILKTNDEAEYLDLQQQHTINLQQPRFNLISTGDLFSVENREHQRKITRANEESRNNFRAIVDEIMIANEGI
jgi:hypothetical protein